MHGLVGLCMSVCNRHVVETQRLQKRNGHWSLSSSTCFRVLQGAFRTLRATVAWILSRAMACCREIPPRHTGDAYSKTGLTGNIEPADQIRRQFSGHELQEACFPLPHRQEVHHVYRPVKLVGEDYSQVLVLLDEDDGLSLNFRGRGSY